MRAKRRLSLTLVGALVGAGALVVVAPPSGAATFTVSNTTDSAVAGSNSLRDVIQNQATTAGGDEVDLVPGATYTLNVCPPTPGGGELGHGNTPLILSTPSGAPATIQQTCANQRVLDQGTGSLTLHNVTVTGGNATGAGGGIAGGGAVTIASSTITGNGATTFGGGVFATDALTVTSSTITDNASSTGGGGIFSDGTITVVDSTIADNPSGGGIGSGGQPITITNSTITENHAVTGGGIFTTGSLTLVYATLANNFANAFANLDAATLNSFASVVAQPQGGGINCLAGTTNSSGYNYEEGTTDCGFGSGPGDVAGGPNAQLGALANNGGPTQTLLPQSGSRLLDAIPVGACQTDGAAGITTDQRGVTRPQGTGCDIGAVEVQVAAPAPPVVITPRFTG
jgi:hypothetical protein